MNHYHLVAQTVEGNLSSGMRHQDGVYTRASNRRHGRSDHLFQGRFKGILVDRDTYLLELTRYVVLNPVRARMVDAPEHWPWSCYRAMIGSAPTPIWLAVEGLLSQFGSSSDEARRRCRAFVYEGMGQDIWHGLRQQIYLGDEVFVTRMQCQAQIAGDRLSVPQAQRPAGTTPFPRLPCWHRSQRARLEETPPSSRIIYLARPERVFIVTMVHDSRDLARKEVKPYPGAILSTVNPSSFEPAVATATKKYPPPASHESDFYTWALESADAIRKGRFEGIDWDAVAEELEDMGRSERRALENRLEVLLAHLIKWRFQHEQRRIRERRGLGGTGYGNRRGQLP
jgi:hypothetical protein